MATMYPTLSYRDAPAALKWLAEAFGFEEVEAHAGPDGTIAHAEMRFGGAIVMFGSPKTERQEAGLGLGGIYVGGVEDVDAHHDRARAAGAEIVRELEDTDYGSREYGARDLEGNEWHFGTYDPATR